MVRLYKRENIWYIDFFIGRKRYQKSTGTRYKSVAKDIAKSIERDIANQRFNIDNFDDTCKVISFNEIAEEWLETHSKIYNSKNQYYNNILRINRHLKPFFKDRGIVNIKNINPKLINDYIAEKKNEGYKNSTINRTLETLRKILNDCITWGYLKQNPFDRISKLKETEQSCNYLNKDEVKIFLENCSKVFYPVACCAVYTGMRVGEIISLKKGKVNLEKLVIEVDKSLEGPTKSRKVRYIPIHTELAEVLKKTIDKNKGEYVFPKNKRGEKRGRDFRTAMKNTLERAGLKKIRFHDLRHTFASNFIMSGGNILSLNKILGHSDLKMTMRYAHLAPDYLEGEIERLKY